MKRKLFISILITLLAGQIYAQLEVDGYIKNIDGEPLPGVSVTIKGTVTGTVSDLKGYYKLSNIPTDGILVFSFLGMLTEEIEVGDKTQIDVTMVDDIKSLDEVVVVGYGSVKRANLTGAVVDIKADELEDIPVGNLSSALDGKLAGVKISSSTGKPGEASVLRIRTESSFGRATEEVLYVIDGVITDAKAFNLLDASEVESISVLKDAAAAVYGARAAGGVVVVKTKRGSEGKPKISYSGSYGIAQATKFPEMLTGGELAGMYNDIQNILHESYHFKIDSNALYTQDEIDYFNSLPQNNWIDDLLKTATTEKHTVNISGGSEKIKYFTGGSYYKEDGMIDLLDYSRYSLRANIEAQVTKNLTTNLGLNYTYKNKMEPNFAGESQSDVLRDTYKQALTAAPWLPVSVNGLPVGNYISSNPLALLNSGSYKNGYGNSSGIRAEIQYKIPFIEGLNLHMQYSRSESNDHGKEYAQNYTVYEFGTNGHIIDETSTPTAKQYDNKEGIQQKTDYSKNYQFNTSINYSKKFGPHDISALLVYEQSESESNNYWTRIERSSSLPGYDYLWAFATSRSAVWKDGSGAGESGNLGLIGRFNYGYAQKYLLETTFRYEASEKFHPDNRWGFFPAVSAGYVISEEDFFKDNITFVNFLKARASAGIVGNDHVPLFLWTPTFTADATGPIFGDELTSALKANHGHVYVPSIHWQVTRSYNIGIDTRMMNNHVKFSLDYYYRHTFQIFNSRSHIPVIVGLNNVKPPDENYGEADARGIEIETGYENSVGEFKYNIDVNFSWDRHKELKRFQSPAVEGSWKDDRLNDPSNQPGYKAIGIMRTQQQLDEWMAKYPDYTIDDDPLELGMIYYEDIRGEEYIDSLTGKIAYLPPDGKITSDDQTIIAKYTSPPFHYGFTLGVSWKGIKVSGTFSGIFGHKVFISKDEQALPDPFSKDITNVFSFWKDYWTPENTDAAYPRPYKYGLDQQVSTFWMKNGHTLRLKSLNISYTIPRSLSQKIGIPDMRVYFSSQNLWTIINPFDHKDPGISRGYDYPLMRTYNFGINITI